MLYVFFKILAKAKADWDHSQTIEIIYFEHDEKQFTGIKSKAISISTLKTAKGRLFLKGTL